MAANMSAYEMDMVTSIGGLQIGVQFRLLPVGPVAAHAHAWNNNAIDKVANPIVVSRDESPVRCLSTSSALSAAAAAIMLLSQMFVCTHPSRNCSLGCRGGISILL